MELPDEDPMSVVPDGIIANIMSFADVGAAPGEPTCPAARFACVSRRWHTEYSTIAAPSLLVQNPLKRIEGWTIRDIYRDMHPTPQSENGEGAETVVDGWVRPPGTRIPAWWASPCVFEGDDWTGTPEIDSSGGPFRVRKGYKPPSLIISFDDWKTVRAFAIHARNRPRRIKFFCGDDERGWTDEGVEVVIPPPLPSGEEETPSISSQEYMVLVAQECPQGTPPTQEALRLRDTRLPVVLPEPLRCKRLAIFILESHERQWVGINKLVFFE